METIVEEKYKSGYSYRLLVGRADNNGLIIEEIFEKGNMKINQEIIIFPEYIKRFLSEINKLFN